MPRRAFTLVELLTVVAIIAALTTAALFFFVNITSWARTTTDKAMLLRINDALTSYKNMGGGTAAFTAGADISAVIDRLRTAVTWGAASDGPSVRLTHQFLNSSFTYPARSLSAVGDGAQYTFYRANSYRERTPASTESTDEAPFGSGVGYISNSNNVAGYPALTFYTTGTSWIAIKNATGSTTYTSTGVTPTISASPWLTFWSCAGNGNPTPAGSIVSVSFMGNYLTSADFRGLPNIGTIRVDNNALTSLKVKGLSNLVTLGFPYNNLTSIDLSGLTGLTTFQAHYNQLTSLNINPCTALTTYSAYGNNNLTTFSVSGLSSLTSVDIALMSSLTSATISNCPALTSISGFNNALTSLTISNCPALSSVQIYNCALSGGALNGVYNALPNRSSTTAGSINVTNNPGTTTDTPSIATAKNWTVTGS